MGAAYALKPDAKTLEARFSGVLDPKGNLNTGLKLIGKVQWDVGSKSDFLRRIVRIAQKEIFLNFALFRNGLMSVDEMRECVEAFVSDVEIETSKIPFGAAAVDLISGKQVIFRHGSMIRAVMASCAVPGFMPDWKKAAIVSSESIPLNLSYNFLTRNEVASHIAPLATTGVDSSNILVGWALPTINCLNSLNMVGNAHPTRKNLCNVGTTLVAKSRCIVPIRRLCF